MNLTINVVDVSGYPGVGTFVSPSGTNITIENTTYSNVNTATHTVTNNSNVTVTITKEGYHSYINTISVFDYDLSLYIFLVPVITNHSDPNYRRPYTYFNRYIKPCSYDVYCVDGSSFPSNYYSYYVNRVKKGADRNFIFNYICPGDYQIAFEKISLYHYVDNSVIWWDEYYINTNQATIATGNFVQNQNTLFDNDTSANITIQEFKPYVNPDITIVGNSCSGDDDCQCIPLGSSITVNPNVVLNLNNQPTPACPTSTIIYQ
ncbi:MAG: hypothetical protein NZM44_02050, partial [Candidatus Calescibacterium sp.]|nr:hypothetical protein [Candidatus Calescibacterium sp.]